MDEDDRARARREAEAPTSASARELDAAADDLSAAFHDDPMLCWFLRDDQRRDAARAGFFRMVVMEIGFADGVIERPASGGAAAMWMRSEDMRAPLLRELKALPVLMYAATLKGMGKLTALRSAMQAHHPHAPHDYLYFLGVRPELQGAGIGSRLLASHTRRLDAAGRAAWLETATPRNLPLYRNHGFEVRAEYHARADAPVMWGMWRDPR